MKNYNFEKLDPKGVLSWFKKICSIPHGSSNEAKLSDFLRSELNKAGCQIKQFTTGAIAIKKAATKGYEKKPLVMLQAHLDMVCVHSPEKKIDMSKEAVKPYYDDKDDCIKCDGTTLGADNGIGVATIMEIMTSDKYQHGPLEGLLSVTEETDINHCMDSIPDKYFKAKHLINLDNDIDDKMYISSNGAMKISAEKKLIYKPIDAKTKTYFVQIDHLEGGHSALMIHYPINNAIKLLSDSIYSFIKDHSLVRLVSFEGGTAMNAIPSRAAMLIQMEPKDLPELKRHIRQCVDTAIELSQGVDKNAGITIKLADQQFKNACSVEETQKILMFYKFVPNAIYRMDLSMRHIFSAGNIGTVRTENGILKTVLMPRSFSIADLEQQFADITYLGKMLGMTNFTKAIVCYPWLTSNPEKSPVIQTWSKSYYKVTGKYSLPVKDPAGLEPSAIIKKNPQLKGNAVAVGPRIIDEHSVKEKVVVKSIETFFKTLLLTLKEIK